MTLAGEVEGLDHVRGLDGEEGIRGQQQPGMVVDQIQDLGVAAAGQLPVGDVELPELVGEGGLEAMEGGLGALAWLRGDLALAAEDPPDGGRRGHLLDQRLEMVGDGASAGVVAGCDQLLAQPQDRGLDVR